jgi:uncharacterized protein (DUF433 family)
MKALNFSPKIPFAQDPDGTIRLRGSRVTLDTLLAALKRGDTPEQIHEGFPSLSLSQICAAISWYLNNQIEADTYHNERVAEAEAIRQRVESRPEQVAFREMMRQRRIS